MFDKCVEMMREQGCASQDVIAVMRLFQDKGGELEERLEDSMKEHLAQDVEKISINDIGALLDLYKNDS